MSVSINFGLLLSVEFDSLDFLILDLSLYSQSFQRIYVLIVVAFAPPVLARMNLYINTSGSTYFDSDDLPNDSLLL